MRPKYVAQLCLALAILGACGDQATTGTVTENDPGNDPVSDGPSPCRHS